MDMAFPFVGDRVLAATEGIYADGCIIVNNQKRIYGIIKTAGTSGGSN